MYLTRDGKTSHVADVTLGAQYRRFLNKNFEQCSIDVIRVCDLKEVICNTCFYHAVCYIFWMRKLKAVTCRASGFGFQFISSYYFFLRELAEVI